jgi:hypothetical protein
VARRNVARLRIWRLGFESLVARGKPPAQRPVSGSLSALGLRTATNCDHVGGHSLGDCHHLRPKSPAPAPSLPVSTAMRASASGRLGRCPLPTSTTGPAHWRARSLVLTPWALGSRVRSSPVRPVRSRATMYQARTRLDAVLAVVLLAGCTGGDDEARSAPTTTSPTTAVPKAGPLSKAEAATCTDRMGEGRPADIRSVALRHEGDRLVARFELTSRPPSAGVVHWTSPPRRSTGRRRDVFGFTRIPHR